MAASREAIVVFASMSDGCNHCGHDWMMHTNTVNVEIACFAEGCDCPLQRPTFGDKDFDRSREDGGIQFDLSALFLRIDQEKAAIARKGKE